MVESGPFIEYCCELYIHHTVLNIIVVVVILFSLFIVLGALWLMFARTYKFAKKCDEIVAKAELKHGS